MLLQKEMRTADDNNKEEKEEKRREGRGIQQEKEKTKTSKNCCRTRTLLLFIARFPTRGESTTTQRHCVDTSFLFFPIAIFLFLFKKHSFSFASSSRWFRRQRRRIDPLSVCWSSSSSLFYAALSNQQRKNLREREPSWLFASTAA